MYISDSLETILSHLSPRVMNVFTNGHRIHDLNLLLEFLAAWERRPECLVQIACQWCSCTSEVVGRLRPGETPNGLPHPLGYFVRWGVRLRPSTGGLSLFAEDQISEVIFSRRDPENSDAGRRRAQCLTPDLYSYFLSIILELGFRLAGTGSEWQYVPLTHASHHQKTFETAFSSYDDEVIADAVCMWMMTGFRAPLDSFSQHFAKRMEKDTPLSPRLRQLSARAIKRIWESGLDEPGLPTVHLLNRLNIDVEVAKREGWMFLLLDVIHGPARVDLSPRYWRLLNELVVTEIYCWGLQSPNMVVVKALREAEEWEKLEVWMAAIWKGLRFCSAPELMEDFQQATVEVLSQRPSALQRFEDLCKARAYPEYKEELQGICDRARAEESRTVPYVFFVPSDHMSA